MTRMHYPVLLAIAAAAALLAFGCGGSSEDGGADIHLPGSLDASFDPGSNIDDWVKSIVVQPDGKILAGGGQPRVTDNTTVINPGSGVLARLNADGSADETFSGWTGVNAAIECIALQGDGKVLIGGQFTTVNGASMGHIARLNADGSIDPDFIVGAGANSGVYSIVANADGTIMIVGRFTTYGGASARYLARLSADGSLDTTYHQSGEGFDGGVTYLAAVVGGGYFAAGSFSSYDGIPRAKLAKLDANGTLDTTFVPVALDSGEFLGIAPRQDGSIVITGSFTSIGGSPRSRIARLTPAGALDPTFDPGTGVEGTDSQVYGLTMQPDGKVLIGGWFTHYDGALHYSPARINEDGSLDAAFVAWNADTDVRFCFAVQGDGKILIGGVFTTCGGQVRRYIARVWP